MRQVRRALASFALSLVVLTASAAVDPVGGGGAISYHLICAATANATSVKGSAGALYGVDVLNVSGTVVYLKFYDKSSAPVPGTDTPVRTYPVPANTNGAGFVRPFPVGLKFFNGIAFAVTANIADNDNTAIGSANVVVVDLEYL